MRVRGTIVAKDVKVLVIEVDRDEYVQRVTVRDPSEALAPVPVDRVITLAGWLTNRGRRHVRSPLRPGAIGPGLVAQPRGQPGMRCSRVAAVDPWPAEPQRILARGRGRVLGFWLPHADEVDQRVREKVEEGVP